MTFRPRARRSLIALLLVLLIAAVATAACGGGDDDDDGGSTATATATATDSSQDGDASADATAIPGGGSVELGEGQAVVEIDGERFEFDVSSSCLVLFGSMSASSNADGLELRANIPPADWETNSQFSPPALRVNDTREETPRWFIADAEDFPNQPEAQARSHVDTVVWDGESRVVGTATFVDAFEYFQTQDLSALVAVSGSYDIECASE